MVNGTREMASFVRQFDKNGKLIGWQARINRRGFPLKTKVFDTKAQAQAWAISIENDMLVTRSFDHRVALSGVTLAKLIRDYQEQVTPKKRGHKQEKLRLDMWLRVPFVQLPVLDIKSRHLAEWRDRRLADGKATATVNHDLNTLSGVYQHAIREWSIEGLTNPIRQIKLPSLGQARERRLEAGEEKRLLAAIEASALDSWLKPAFIIAIETALRQGNILELTWGAIDLKRRVLRVRMTKNGSPLEVPISKVCLAALHEWKKFRKDAAQPDDLLFKVKPGTIQNAWRRICAEAGIKDLRWHDLRHEATSRLFEKGLRIEQVRAITGHKTLAMLMRYTNLRAVDLLDHIDRPLPVGHLAASSGHDF